MPALAVWVTCVSLVLVAADKEWIPGERYGGSDYLYDGDGNVPKELDPRVQLWLRERNLAANMKTLASSAAVAAANADGRLSAATMQRIENGHRFDADRMRPVGPDRLFTDFSSATGKEAIEDGVPFADKKSVAQDQLFFPAQNHAAGKAAAKAHSRIPSHLMTPALARFLETQPNPEDYFIDHTGALMGTGDFNDDPDFYWPTEKNQKADVAMPIWTAQKPNAPGYNMFNDAYLANQQAKHDADDNNQHADDHDHIDADYHDHDHVEYDHNYDDHHGSDGKSTFAVGPNDPRFLDDGDFEREHTTEDVIGAVHYGVDVDGNGSDETEAEKELLYRPVVQEPLLHEHNTLTPLTFIAIVAACCTAGVVAVVLLAVCSYKLQKGAKAAADVEYPAYGVTGPSKDISPGSADRRLAQSAQMYHYQHQKQQIIAMERASSDRRASVSEPESDDDNEEGDYTVYECPGLASTREMEVRNPLFLDDATPTPVSPARQASSPAANLPPTPELPK